MKGSQARYLRQSRRCQKTLHDENRHSPPERNGFPLMKRIAAMFCLLVFCWGNNSQVQGCKDCSPDNRSTSATRTAETVVATYSPCMSCPSQYFVSADTACEIVEGCYPSDISCETCLTCRPDPAGCCVVCDPVWSPPACYYVGYSAFGQPTIHVPGQPVRNFMRSFSP